MENTQGANNNFDFSAMDFNGFAMPQQSYRKPDEGNTSGFYFDEGIDTSGGASFSQQSFDTMFAADSTGYAMQQPLTVDNTTGSAPWGNTMNSFPPTPVQSFDSLYNPQYSTTLGKRPLQLDVQDFPQPKRHETGADFPAFSPYPSSASVTGSSWAVDTQPTPSSSTDIGLSDEAADVCATWFSKYNILPSDRHIESLSQLTGESAAAIRHWFGQALKQGLNGHDSAYKSQTGFTQPQPMHAQAPGQANTSEAPCIHDNQTSISHSPLRGGKKGCNPTDDPDLLKRDPNKIYQCTRKCGKRYGRKCDWKRNEEEGYPSKSWVCSLCKSQGVERVKPCFRKYHFSQHFRNIHPGNNCADYEEASIVHSDTAFPRKCGFCSHRFESRQERIDHIADHFKQGKCMLDWNDDEDENHDSDNMDDDDDNDRPDSGGFDSSKPFYPPNSGPQGGSGSKDSGNRSDGHGRQQPPGSGFFQFQLSQFNENDAGCKSSGADQHIKPVSDQANNKHRLRAPEEQGSTHGRHEAAERDHSISLAEDALTQSLNQQGLQSDDLLHPVSKPEQHHRPISSSKQSSLSGAAKPVEEAFNMKSDYSRGGARLQLFPLYRGTARGFSGLILKSLMEALVQEGRHEVGSKVGSQIGSQVGSHGVGCAEFLSQVLIAIMLAHLNLSAQEMLSAYRSLYSEAIQYSDLHLDSLSDKLAYWTHAPQPSPLLPPPLSSGHSDLIEMWVQFIKGFAKKHDKNQHTLNLSSQDSCLDSEEFSLLAISQSTLPRLSPVSWMVSEHSLLTASILDSNAAPVPVSVKYAKNSIPYESAPDSLLQYWKGITSLLDSKSFLSVKLLGTGGFSTVDEVVHRETSLRISRKTLKNREQSALEELKKEVDVLQKLRHPHIIRFLGAYSKGDKMSILLSPVAETTLALWLDKVMLTRPKGLAQTIVKMFGCLSSSIRYLHEQRPVVKHMDVKPQNILIMQGNQEFPHVVLSDFGISSFEEVIPNEQSKPLTRQYCAPEVSEGISRQRAADIWSLGCVFAEMAVAAFREDNPYWLEFRREFSGREGKYYWQDIPSLQDWLSQFLDQASTLTEAAVVRMVRSMLSAEPSDRPNAALLTMVFTPAPCCLSWPNAKVFYPSPLEELQTVEMLVDEDGVDCRAQLHIHTQADETQQLEPFSHAKCWLDECLHEHEVCRSQATDAKSLPTRLIDIRPNGAQGFFVRLVDSARLNTSLEDVKYVALSYIWDQDDISLSTDRLQAMQSELPRDALPRAINEAISAADHMGYRYIWVDLLCVLQDSEEDKQRECKAMVSTYRNAALTIVLDLLSNIRKTEINTGEDSSSNDSKPIPYATLRATGRSVIEQMATPPTFLPAIDFLTPGFAWDTRAWSLQERLLSRRLLHLGHEQMYWECNALKASETFPRGLPPLLWEKVHTKFSSADALLLPPRLKYKHAASTTKLANASVSLAKERARGVAPRYFENCQWIKEKDDYFVCSHNENPAMLDIPAHAEMPQDFEHHCADGAQDIQPHSQYHRFPMKVSSSRPFYTSQPTANSDTCRRQVCVSHQDHTSDSEFDIVSAL